MRSAIIFDIGGVLKTYRTIDYCKWVKEQFKVEKDTFQIYKDIYPLRDSGKMSDHQMYLEYLKRTGLSEQVFPYHEYNEVYFNEFSKNNLELLNFIENNLYGKYKLYIFSNNHQTGINYFKLYYPLADKIFDKCISSHEIGYRKPDPEFFRIGLETIGEKGENCVFFDDQLKSKEITEKNGIQFFQYTDFEQFKKDWDELTK